MCGAECAAPVNARTASGENASPRGGDHDVKRASSNADSLSVISRAATRRATSPRSGATSGDDVRGRATSRAAMSTTVARSAAAAKSRAATVSGVAPTHIARSGVAAVARSGASSARSATNATSGVARAGVARATAVFNDVSKIGSGYAQCREAYATCMDQFCANANDTYRRCICSSRYSEFRDTEAALDQAKNMLVQFENNNLNAVNMTAAEVNAMYSASEGESAIKRDTSAAAQMLEEIGDLLSGKTKATPTPGTNSGSGTSLGILDTGSLGGDLDDIWAGGGNSIFDSGTSADSELSTLEGVALYSRSNNQCLEVMSDSCASDAVLNMARSSYSIMITQDCNIYQKKIDSQREAVMQTVRTAEKYLREARLEEYRSHNSADVNECITKVRDAMLADVACGPNYNRCLDYTGVYINQTTGEPIYTQRLFQLQDLIVLDGQNGDVLAQNTDFSNFLESRRMFAETALDSCRDISGIVWNEFKRSALIEIAQAQDDKIEEVKMSCVNTIKECYDTQSGGLKNMDTNTAKVSGALSAYAARSMCVEEVSACASLYGDTDGCEFDGNGKLTTGNNNNGKRCGLTELLAFVDTVDEVRVAEGCEVAIDTYLKDLCTPETGDQGYPWKCRKKIPGDIEGNSMNAASTASVADNVRDYAMQRCDDPANPAGTFGNMPMETRSTVRRAIQDLQEQMDAQLMEECEKLDGYWVSTDDPAYDENIPLLNAFYNNVYGGDEANYINKETAWGKCVENTTMMRCLAYNSPSSDSDDTSGNVATYDLAKDECTFVEEWYQQKCEQIGGYYEASVCYVAKD